MRYVHVGGEIFRQIMHDCGVQHRQPYTNLSFVFLGSAIHVDDIANVITGLQIHQEHPACIPKGIS